MAAIAAVIGPVFLRVKGVYFVLLTFALGEGIVLVFQEWVSLFGGNNGIHGIPKASLFGMVLLTPRSYYYLRACLGGGHITLSRLAFFARRPAPCSIR